MINQQIQFFKKNISLTYLRNFTRVHYIDLSEIIRFVKAAIIVISVHLKISTLFVVRHVLSAKVSPEWRSNQGFGTQKTCSFPLNRGVSTIEGTHTKFMRTFFWDQILCPFNGGIP